MYVAAPFFLLNLADGLWGSWSFSCEADIWTKNRACDNPQPINGGKDCQGKATETLGFCVGKIKKTYLPGVTF